MGYAQMKQVKSLLNIPDSVLEPEEKINDRMVEADDYINTQISIHVSVPRANLNLTNDKELVGLSSSLAASTYNYWQTPAKDRTIEAIEKWEKRIQDHIMAVYAKMNPTGVTNDTFSKTASKITGME